VGHTVGYISHLDGEWPASRPVRFRPKKDILVLRCTAYTDTEKCLTQNTSVDGFVFLYLFVALSSFVLLSLSVFVNSSFFVPFLFSFFLSFEYLACCESPPVYRG
jgi:hypothetical protein